MPRGIFARVSSISRTRKAMRSWDAVVLLEAQDLAAQPAELGTQCLDAGDVIDIGSGSAHAFLRTVIFSCAAQYFSRAVPGSPGR